MHTDDLCDCTGGPPGVFAAMRAMFDEGRVYVRGGRILVALNPYRDIEGLYDGAHVTAIHGSAAPDQERPHIFVLAEQVFRALVETGRSQSVLITGESGAGKTESAKYILQYLRLVTQSDEGLEGRIQATSPLTEAFGCARTVRNDNSSRFGKFLALNFGESGRIAGATLSTYLLEKSRVTHFGEGECSYHAFYAHLEHVREVFGSYEYLKHGAPPPKGHAGVDELDGSLDRVGFEAAERAELWTTLHGVLALGNVAICARGDGVQVEVSAALRTSAEALGFPPEALQVALTSQTIRAGGDKVQKAHSFTSSCDARDAVAREVYARLFDRIVSAINACIAPSERCRKDIGVVDIFGFECFVRNSLEQLCINYTNEKLQSLFMQVVVQDTLAAYKAEGIAATKIEYKTSADVDDLFERRSGGVWVLLQEECSVPRGSDGGFSEKLCKVHGQSTVLRQVKGKSIKEGFLVKHYAGPVEYGVEGWLEKNRSTLVSDMMTLLQSSGQSLVRSLFVDETQQQQSQMSLKSSRAPGKGKKASTTLLSVFRMQLQTLCDVLRSSELHFLRCVKPNDCKASGEWDECAVERQMTASGMFVALEVMRSGYPERMSHAEFAGLFVPDKSSHGPGSARDRCAVFLAAQLDKSSYAIGKTKVFLTVKALSDLRNQRVRMLQGVAIRIQSHVRRRQAQKTLLRLRKERERALAVVRELIAREDAAADEILRAIDAAQAVGARNSRMGRDLLAQAAKVAKQRKKKRGLASTSNIRAVDVDPITADDTSFFEQQREIIQSVERQARRKSITTVAPLESVIEYALLINMPIDFVDLLWVADEALRSGVPPGWKRRLATNGEHFYTHPESGDVSWLHPNDHLCLRRHGEEMDKLSSERTQTEEGVRLLTRDLFGTDKDRLQDILVEPASKLTRCFLARNKIRGKFDMFLQVSAEKGVYCMTAQRQPGKACHYSIYIEQKNNTHTVLGELVAIADDYALFRSGDRADKHQVLGVSFLPTSTNPRGMCAVQANRTLRGFGVDDDVAREMHVLLPVEPSINPRSRRPELGFGGRAVAASTHNMQLRVRDQTHISFLLGKVSATRFNLDFGPPMTPLSALGLALAIFED